MSENQGGWPRDPRDYQGRPGRPQDPRGRPQGQRGWPQNRDQRGYPEPPPGQRPRRPQPGPHPQVPTPPQVPPRPQRRPEPPAGYPPPGYEPMRRDPGYDDVRQRPARPGAGQWQPAQASYGEDPRDSRFYDQDREPIEPARIEPTYTDEDDAGQFVPGFGFGDERNDRTDYDYDDEDDSPVITQPERGRRAAHGTRRTSRGGGRGSGRGTPPGGRRPDRRRARWIAPLVALLVILIPIGIGGYYVYGAYQNKYHPADYAGAGTGSVVVQVTSGDTATTLAPKLVTDGVVASSRAFILAAEKSSDPSGLKPGFYKMHKQMKASLAYAQLLNPSNVVQVTVTIPEGWRASQIVSYLGAKSGIPQSAYEQVLKNPAQLSLPAWANNKPEGYLFPATYEVLPHETAAGVLKAMVARFDQEATTVNLSSAASQVHLTPAQVITMASLVEAEGGRLSDYPKIARVIYNRLNQGMPLQLDSTVLYGLGKYGIIASDQQLTSTSPYNTYKYKGLPPGPIDSPGNAAIQAVLHPASGSWVYFVTVNPKTGETLFTSSQAQFEQYRQELQKNLGQG